MQYHYSEITKFSSTFFEKKKYFHQEKMMGYFSFHNMKSFEEEGKACCLSMQPNVEWVDIDQSSHIITNDKPE